MAVNDLRLCRSLLFLPASNPRAIEKAKTLPADMVILDLEDAVRPEDKEKARAMAVEALPAFEGRQVAVRINAFGSDQFGAGRRRLPPHGEGRRSSAQGGGREAGARRPAGSSPTMRWR